MRQYTPDVKGGAMNTTAASSTETSKSSRIPSHLVRA